MSLETVGGWALGGLAVVWMLCDAASRWRDAIREGLPPVACTVITAILMVAYVAAVAVALLAR